PDSSTLTRRARYRSDLNPGCPALQHLIYPLNRNILKCITTNSRYSASQIFLSNLAIPYHHHLIEGCYIRLKCYNVRCSNTKGYFLSDKANIRKYKSCFFYPYI